MLLCLGSYFNTCKSEIFKTLKGAEKYIMKHADGFVWCDEFETAEWYGNDEIHFWYKDENNELVKSTYNLDKVKIYETNIEKTVVKFGYGLFNRVVSVELSISRDYIK